MTISKLVVNKLTSAFERLFNFDYVAFRGTSSLCGIKEFRCFSVIFLANLKVALFSELVQIHPTVCLGTQLRLIFILDWDPIETDIYIGLEPN